MDLCGDDVAFILGRNARTKLKLERIANVRLEFVKDPESPDGTIAYVVGKPKERKAGIAYLGWVMDQRVGDVEIDPTLYEDTCVLVDVPRSCMGFVTGTRGQSLREIESEWGTLLFFVVDVNDKFHPNGERKSKMAIFGNRWGRRGSQLKVMTMVENKEPGTFCKKGPDGKAFNPFTDDDRGDDFGTTILQLEHSEYAYALGTRGMTKRKIAAASGCIIEFVGLTCFLCGSEEDRKRATQYLKWLLAQRTNAPGRAGLPEMVDLVIDISGRDDVIEIPIPPTYVGWIRGKRGQSLRDIESQSHTFCFSDSDRNQSNNRVLIFSHDPENRAKAARLVKDRIRAKERIEAGIDPDTRLLPRGGPPPPPPRGHRDDYDRRDSYGRRSRERDDYRRDDYDRGRDYDYDRGGRDYDRRDGYGRGRDDYDRAPPRRDRSPPPRRDDRDYDRDYDRRDRGWR